MKNSLKILLLGISLSGCLDLDEEVYSEVTASNFYQNEEEVVSAVMRPYAHLRQVFLNFSTNGCGVFLLQELSTDEAAWPTKGRDGFDNGNWIRLHRHEWTVEDGSFAISWNDMYKGIALCNNLLFDFKDIDAVNSTDKLQYQAELRGLRALYYYYLLDLFGNVPVVTAINQFSPANNTRVEVFNFIEEEILDIRVNLPKKGDIGWYGRFTQEAANSLLSRLYLNAEVYTGEARWSDCIEVSRLVLGPSFSLEAQWDAPFKTDNYASDENVFAIPADELFGNDLQQMFQFTTHWQQREPQFGYQGNGGYNGMVSVREFIETYDTLNDARCFFDSRVFIPGNENDPTLKRGQFMWGPQYGRDGNPILGTNDKNGQHLVFELDVPNMEDGNEASGARNIKYQVEYGAVGFSNDIVLFRLAEIYFNIAEASLRNGGMVPQDVLDEINVIRNRANVPTYQSLTLDELYDERGREMAYEGLRRTDMIRYKKYTGNWWDKEASDGFRTLFPIPQSSRNVNPNLDQNPGYPN